MAQQPASADRPRRSFLSKGNPFVSSESRTGPSGARASERSTGRSAFSDDQNFRILTVCTGNICRSPLAQLLLATKLDGLATPVQVSSAGTHAPVDAPIEPTVAQIAVQRFHLDPSAHRARRLNEQHLLGSDLILVLSNRHLSRVLDLVPSAVGRVFTVNEYARISATISSVTINSATMNSAAGGVDAAPRSLLEHVDLAGSLRSEVRSRGQHEPTPPGCASWLDIADPMGQPFAVHREVAERIDRATDAIAAGLRASAVSPNGR